MVVSSPSCTMPLASVSSKSTRVVTRKQSGRARGATPSMRMVSRSKASSSVISVSMRTSSSSWSVSTRQMRPRSASSAARIVSFTYRSRSSVTVRASNVYVPLRGDSCAARWRMRRTRIGP